VEYVSAVVLLVSVSVTPGKVAAVGSVMVPLNPPVTMVCASNSKGEQNIFKQQKRAMINKFFPMNFLSHFRNKLNARPSRLLRTPHHRTTARTYRSANNVSDVLLLHRRANMEADLTVRGTHQLALRLSLAISKESARAINVSRHFIRTLALRCSCMCAPMTESGIRRVGIFIFLSLLNLLPNDKINSIKRGSPRQQTLQTARSCVGPSLGSGFSDDASGR